MYSIPSHEVLIAHFVKKKFWDPEVHQLLKNHFADRNFTEERLTSQLVLRFPEEWVSIFDELKKLLAPQASVATS